LPAAEALEVSSIYNAVTGVRLLITGLSSPEMADADDEVQLALVAAIADGIERNYLPAQNLVERLKAISRQSLWCAFCS
jgi:hypothetical protein